MRRALGVAVGVGLLCAATRAHAGAIQVDEVYAEPDLHTEAGAVTLLLRSRLGHDAKGIWVARGGLYRDGTGLSATIVVYEDGDEVVGTAVARAHFGEVDALAARLAARIAALADGLSTRESSASLGELRPFLDAREAVRRGDYDAATSALRRAKYAVCLRVPAARDLLRAITGDESLPIDTRAAAALAAGDSDTAMKLSEARLEEDPQDGTALGTRVRARLARFETDAAAAELATSGSVRSADLELAAAELAERTGGREERDRALTALFDGEGDAAALALVADLPPKALPRELERKALASARRHRDQLPGLASSIGVRAAAGEVDLDDALSVIDVAELDQEEMFTLDNVLDKLDVLEDGSLNARRAAAAAKLRAGDLEGARAVASRALERNPDDPTLHRYLARIASEQGDHETAIEEWQQVGDGSRDTQRELARELVLAGQPQRAAEIRLALGDADSIEVECARASNLLAAGDSHAAVLVLERAARRAPYDRAVLAQLAAAYDATDEPDKAAHARGLAKRLPDAPGRTTRSATNRTASARPATPDSDSEQSRLAGELRPLLRGFDALDGDHYEAIAVVRFGSSREPIYGRYQTNPRSLGAGIAFALREPPLGIDTVDASDDRALPEPLRDADLELAASDYDVDAVLAYQAHADGTKAALRLVLYDAAEDTATEIRGSIDGRDTGVLEWNPWFFVLCAGAVLLLVGLVARGLRMTGGDLNVRVIFDPCAEKETFALFLRRSAKRPRIRPDFFSVIRKRGLRHRRRSASLIGPYSRFENLPLGTWYVHLIGRFDKGGIPTEIEPRCEQVTVERRRVAYVCFDLVPKTTTYRVTFTNAEGPQADVPVWLNDASDQVILSPEDGVVELEVEPGVHILHFEIDGFAHERELLVLETRIYTLTINVERERRMRAAAEGIPLEEEDFPLPAPSAPFASEPASAAAGGVVASAPRRAGPPSVRVGGDLAIAATAFDVEPLVAPPLGARPFASGSEPGAGAEPAAGSGRIAHGSVRTDGAAALPDAPVARGIDRYQKLCELGSGAIGVVYRARDQVLEREVALKIMTDRFRAHPEARKLFLREARSLAQLDHPNIVSVYDQGDDGGQPFIVMELVDGSTLEDVLRTEDVSILRAVRLVGQLSAGLAYAHASGIVHRDVKPANVFLTRDDRVKLGDFGIARMFTELRMRQTEVRGTPPYMAPEQIVGTDIDFRSDLYSVGCTLFEMVAGRPPFLGAGGQVLFHHLHTEPPALSNFARGIPPALDAIVASLLAKDKAHRFGSAEAVRNALGSVEEELASRPGAPAR